MENNLPIDKLLKKYNIKTLPHDRYLKAIQEEDAVLACMDIPTLGFPDNLQGECTDCGKPIYYRPYNQPAKVKLCPKCFLSRFEKEEK